MSLKDITGFTLVTAFLVTVVHGQISVNVDISESHALPLDNITVVCRLTGNHRELSVFWYKEVRDDQGTAIKELIASGDILSPLYDTLGRFHAKVTPIGMTTLYILSLTLVTFEDSGHYGCYVGGDADVYDSESLVVYKLPDAVSFTNTSGGLIYLTEDHPPPVECQVLGVIPTPRARIWVGDTDYTDMFSTETHTEVMCSDSFGTKENCPLHFIYNVYLRHAHFSPSNPGPDQKLRCEVDLPGSGYSRVTTELQLVYQFSPKFECDRVVYTVMGTTNYNLSCLVTFNPEFDWWSWSFDLEDLTYELRSDRDPGYTHTGVKVREEKLSRNSVVLSLLISEVTLPYYTVYRLQAANTQGNATVVIQLREIVEPETTTQTISKAVMSSFSVYLLLTLLSFLFLLNTRVLPLPAFTVQM